jgi:hypothetical protein
MHFKCRRCFEALACFNFRFLRRPLIEKCELPDSIGIPAFFLTLGLSLVLESKLEEKKGRQKWVDLQHEWVQFFEDEMANQKDRWWEQNKGDKPAVQGSIGWWSFYEDTKWFYTPRA